MAFFSRKQHTVPIRPPHTDSSDPILADIIDLRKLNNKKKETSDTKTPQSTTREEAPKTAAPSQKKSRQEDAFEAFFDRKKRATAEPKIVSEYLKPKPRAPFSKVWRYVIGVCVGAAIIGVLMTTVFASATIIIQPKKAETALKKISLTVDPSLSLADADSGRIPGERVQYSDIFSVTAPATGQMYVQTRAHGTITIKNSYSSSPQTLVQSTRFEEKISGKVFRLTHSITIPGAKIAQGAIVPSTIDAEALADGVGDAYNISHGDFTIPGFKGSAKYAGFTAVLKEPMTGGFKGTTKVITKDDLQKAQDALTEKARTALQDKNSKELSSDFTVLPSAQTFSLALQSPPHANDPGESFTLTGQARLEAVAFRIKDIEALLASSLQKDIQYEKTPDPDATSLTFDSAALSADGKLRLSLSGTLTTLSVINTDTIRATLAGKPSAEARTILLGDSAIAAFGVKIFPFWRNTIPASISRITVATAR